MPRRRHPKPDIEAAIEYAERHGWSIQEGGAHAWGKMRCPYNDHACRGGEFCIMGIWSTPRNPGNHGKQLRRVVDRCVHEQAKSEATSRDSDDA